MYVTDQNGKHFWLVLEASEFHQWQRKVGELVEVNGDWMYLEAVKFQTEQLPRFSATVMMVEAVKLDPTRIAPWPDFAGNLIRQGDMIVHPSGERAIVNYDETREESGRWRAVYDNGESLWLGNQIGSKGMAVVMGKSNA